MTKLFMKCDKNSPLYKNWVKNFGQAQVDAVYEQFDEMEQWIKEMPTEQLIKYVGCQRTFDQYEESRDYIQENFPDLLENKFLFQMMSSGAHNELKCHRGYRDVDVMLEEFYQLMDIVPDEESPPRQLTKFELAYSIAILIGLAILGIKILNWLF